jgi:acyl-coenzyme A thioesterase PaaI-like protein
MTNGKSEAQQYRVPFVERTGMQYLAKERGYVRLLMPLAPNANHVDVMYMGAYTVLAEAAAANPGIEIAVLQPYALSP